MKALIKELVLDGAKKAFDAGMLNSDAFPDMEIEQSRHDAHGDLSTNFAMISASIQKMAPRKIAEAVIEAMDGSSTVIEKTEIAGPGFINFFLKKEAWHSVIEKIHRQNSAFGASNLGRGKKVQVEFVSANPTGPLHIGHGRGAAVGDAIGNILGFAGFDVQREYYINDSGRQIRTLGLSVWLRLLEVNGKTVDFPEECYKGAYIREIAQELKELKGDALLEAGEEEGVQVCARFAADKILSGIKRDLDQFGVTFDNWFSEQTLYDSGKVMAVIDDFKEKEIIYEEEKALWFKTEQYGDAKDRVVVRNNGLTTYFASDIAYHMEKFDRGFDRVIDVWGADHHGYIQRINASIDASGRKSDQFDVILVQLVNLLRGGKPVAMSTRAGEFVTLKDIVDEVGRDAARFLFLSRSYDSGLDFDLELARQQTSENPVYYVQYVHARISSMVARAVEEKLVSRDNPDWAAAVSSSPLVEAEEINLIKILAAFPENVERSAATLHPHVIFTYLMRLASAFHGYYNKHKVLTEERELSRARLSLVVAVKTVIRNGLDLLGVSAPEKM
ncbi:MAG: arginine--tRNA ligase [Desulfobacteraceae bacterium]